MDGRLRVQLGVKAGKESGAHAKERGREKQELQRRRRLKQRSPRIGKLEGRRKEKGGYIEMLATGRVRGRREQNRREEKSVKFA